MGGSHVSPFLGGSSLVVKLVRCPGGEDDAPRGVRGSPRLAGLVPPRGTPLCEGLVLAEYLNLSMKILSC